MPRQTTSRNLINSENNPRADAFRRSVVADIFAYVGRVFSSAKFATGLAIAALIGGAISTVNESVAGVATCLVLVIAGLWLEGKAIRATHRSAHQGENSENDNRSFR